MRTTEVAQTLTRVLIARITDEAIGLGECCRSEELGIRLHRVALRDAATTEDAERLLMDQIRIGRIDAPLLGRSIRILRVEIRLDRANLVPERRHVDDEILDHRQVAHRRHRDRMTSLDKLTHRRLAGQRGTTIDTHAARTTDRHTARLTIRKRAIARVLDRVERVQNRCRDRDRDGKRVETRLARLGVEAAHLDGRLHRLRVVRTLEGGEVGILDRGHISSSVPVADAW